MTNRGGFLKNVLCLFLKVLFVHCIFFLISVVVDSEVSEEGKVCATL